MSISFYLKTQPSLPGSLLPELGPPPPQPPPPPPQPPPPRPPLSPLRRPLPLFAQAPGLAKNVAIYYVSD